MTKHTDPKPEHVNLLLHEDGGWRQYAISSYDSAKETLARSTGAVVAVDATKGGIVLHSAAAAPLLGDRELSISEQVEPARVDVKRNRSAACGAWEHEDGRNAHEHCTGTVNLPAPQDVCSCWCHGREDGEDFDGNGDEWEAYVEAHREYEAEVLIGFAGTFADWLVLPVHLED